MKFYVSLLILCLLPIYVHSESDYERQVREFDEQTEIAERQLQEVARQQELAEKQLKVAEEQQERMEQLLIR